MYLVKYNMINNGLMFTFENFTVVFDFSDVEPVAQNFIKGIFGFYPVMVTLEQLVVGCRS
nr:hypothetical protein [Victivallis sp. Marseille-Q1083]